MAAQAPTKTKGSGLGVTALVLGILGFILSFIPFIGIGGIILGFIALAFGGIGFFVSHRWLSLAGFILGVGAIALGFYTTNAGINAVDHAVNPTVTEVTPAVKAPAANEPAAPPAASNVDTYVYKATGQGTVMYTSLTGSGTSTSDETLAGTWTKTYKVSKDGFVAPSVMVSTDGTHTGTLTCTITKNGAVVANQSAHGELGSAYCSG